jgi:hypothetical protein
VVRNAGGVARDDAIRLLLISQGLPRTREKSCSSATPDCDMLTLGDDEAKAAVVTKTSLAPLFAVHALADLDRGCPPGGRADQASPLVPHKHAVSGYVCEVAHGRLRRCCNPRRDHLG